MVSTEDFQRQMKVLRDLAASASNDAEAREVVRRASSLARMYRIAKGIGMPKGVAEQACELDPGFKVRPHIQYLSDRLAQAVRDVECGRNRMLAVSMPPRSGKSTLVSKYGPLWLLRRHPEWKIVMSSHDGDLVASWAGACRQVIEENPSLGIALKRDGGAGGRWDTQEGGGVFSVSVRGALTGRGARVLIVDDPIANFVDAHSKTMRETLWNWWLSVAYTRLEPPYLVLMTMTRWHSDDIVGRLFSEEYEGDPKQWERISIPALAEEHDVIGRKEGEPLLSPMQDETQEEALARIKDIKQALGSYSFASMYQQRPAPAKGAIFDSSWWRFWTIFPHKATEDGRVVYVDPATFLGAKWLDSWDASFKSKADTGGDWVVGQRWARVSANRYLISQRRGRWSFTQTLAEMNKWTTGRHSPSNPYGNMVHERLIEERANGAAIIDVLKEQVSGIKPVNPTIAKESRARAVTPECESGHVFLPHPTDPGNEWMQDFLSELRNFPHDTHDDQVDCLTQGLSGLREPGRGLISVPGSFQNPKRDHWAIERNIGRTAESDRTRPRALG